MIIELPTMNNDNESLPIDIFQRYTALSRTLFTLGIGKGTRILDVGGEGHLGRFNGAKVVECNLTPRKPVGLKATKSIAADGALLPFGDGVFDCAVSLDTLEHVSPKHRLKLVDELLRVSRGRVVVAFPSYDKDVIAHERMLAKFTDAYARTAPNINLAEHARYCLPDASHIGSQLKRRGYSVAIFGNANLHSWLITMMVEATLAEREKYVGLLGSIREHYNSHYGATDNRSPVYRKFIAISKTPFTEFETAAFEAENLPQCRADVSLIVGEIDALSRMLTAPEEIVAREMLTVEVGHLTHETAVLKDRVETLESEKLHLEDIIEIKENEIAALKDFRRQVEELPIYKVYASTLKKIRTFVG